MKPRHILQSSSATACRISFIFLVYLLLAPLTLKSQSRDDCLMCHADESLTMERNGKEVSLHVDAAVLRKSPHQKLLCIACHTGFNPENIPHKEKIRPIDCRTCHRDANLKHRFHPQIGVGTGTNGTPDVSCKQCHGTHNVVSPRNPESKFHRSNLSHTCGTCHREVSKTFDGSEHGKALAANIKGSPDCIFCHKNDITEVNGKRSLAQLKVSQEKVCLSCHLDDPNVRARTTPTAGFIAAYEKSVHGAALLNGNDKAANCVDCHGSHEMKKSFHPDAPVHKGHIVETCGKCHDKIANEFAHSVHGESLARGIKGSPGCTDCHGEHNILSPQDPRSPVAPLNVSGQTCSPCHTSLRLSEKYGIRTDKYRTFEDSYHGLAIKAGSVEVANCASCHGSHNIKRSSDPTSTIHKSNLAKTCGSCHPGANERFAIGSVHVRATKEEEPLLYWISTAYVIIIVLTIGGMFVHNAADFVKKAKRKLRIRRGSIEHHHVGHGLYLRMTFNERLQHGVMALSFIILTITGFMLRYPEAWWVVSIRDVSSYVFEIRSLLHRIAGVAMVLVSLYHVYYVMFTPRGRRLVFDMLPRREDIGETIGMIKFNFGLSEEKPLLGRFSYIEKAEYWALVWGTIVMCVTGIILWFDNTFMGLLTKLGWDVARTIHFYEAWLAMLAIIVWHFYFVIFNPDSYPMNLAWLKGTLTREEMMEEHPRELAEIDRSEGRAEATIEIEDVGSKH
ncbi:MAG: cytochrome B [Ignavibacteria bacterium]|nr:cytochrome B [Ignavibacteria bacterium]